MPESLLGFDFGQQRIGVAVGQQVTGTATAICTLQSRDGKPDWDTISDLIKEWQNLHVSWKGVTVCRYTP
jgi:putative Holliday junction resolvase